MAIIRPTKVILPTGSSAYLNGVAHAPADYSPGIGISHALVMRPASGAESWTRKTGSVSDQRTWSTGSLANSPHMPSFGGDAITFAFERNGAASAFTKQSSVSGVNYYTSNNAEMQIERYPGAYRCLVRYKVQANETISSLSVVLSGVSGSGSSVNLARGGAWNGRISGTFGVSKSLQVYVRDAVEKYPCGYSFSGSNLNLIMHSSAAAKDESKSGAPDLKAFLTGNVTYNVPSAYVSLMSSDNELMQAAIEVSATTQAGHVGTPYLSMEFWLSQTDTVEVTAPIVLLDGFSNYIWSQVRPGRGNKDLQPLEAKLLEYHQTWLANGARGQIKYGDFNHDDGSYYRFWMANHYFHVTASWRSVLRTGKLEWYELARVFSSVVRDKCWQSGQASHAKGLAPWSGSYSGNGHWCDSEAMLMAWLVDGDYFARLTYNEWAANYYDPTAAPTVLGREGNVTYRMCRVAYAFTGTAIWNTRANALKARLQAEVVSAKQQSQWVNYKILAGITGAIWHPLVDIDVVDSHSLAGIFNGYGQTKHANMEQSSGWLLRGPKKFVEGATAIKPGPLGEAMLTIQMELIYDYFRVKRVQGLTSVLYATMTNPSAADYSLASVKVNVEIPRTGTHRITSRIISREGGDIHPTSVRVVDPSGNRTVLSANMINNQNIGTGYFPIGHQLAYLPGGFVAYERVFEYTANEVGRHVIEFGGHMIGIFGPLTEFVEFQDGVGAIYPGQDSQGAWDENGILIGSE